MRVLALDVGSSSVRAVLHDEHARALGVAQRSYETRYGRDGSAELDPDELVGAALAVLAEAGGSEDAVAISCFWHSLLLLDGDGRPLTPVLLWQDRRAAAQAQELSQRLDPERVHERTGCVLHPSYWPAKLAWLATEQPQTLARAGHAVSFGDYLFLRLTGGLKTTLSTASGTGLLDVRSHTWDPELIDALELDPGLLPRLDGDPEGRIYPPLGDGACSNLGVGCATPDRAALMIGTSGAYRVLRDGEPEVRSGLFSYLLDERRVVEGGAVSDGGNLLDWLRRVLDLDVATVDWGRADAHGLTFLPLLGGERSTGWNARATGAIAGLDLAVEPRDVAQAALEGVAYRLADVAERLQDVREVVATGRALLANPQWAQVCADALGRPVTASAVQEGSARGAAVYALERLGIEASPAPLGRRYEPDSEATEAYLAARLRQRGLYERLF
jgi:gluconokinase